MWDQILNNYTLRIVLIGTILIGITSGIIGVLLTLKKEALIGDALSHAALPGVVFAYILTNESSFIISILGAVVASIVSIGLMEMIRKYSKIKNDAILAMILSSFFGLGQVLLSMIGNTAGQDQARLKKFIFGQAATMSEQDIFFLITILIVVLHIIVLFFRHFKLYIFNREYYRSLGFSGSLISFLINMLTIFVVVSGIQAVGVILMSALLIAPAVAARLWSNRLINNILLASIFGGISGFLGTLYGMDVSTGPVITIFASIIVLISLLVAPKTGVIWIKVTEKIHQKQIKKYHILVHLYEENNDKVLNIGEIKLFLEQKYIEKTDDGYELTSKGRSKAISIMAGDLK